MQTRLEGARRAALPRVFEPQLATLVEAPPEGDEWLHELKLDGYRIIARLEKGSARLLTRNGLDWTDRFASVAAAVAKLPMESGLLDGEAVVLDAEGHSSFQALQGALGTGGRELHLFLFDLIFLDGHDLCALPLERRKEVLKKLLKGQRRSPLRFSDHVRGQGAAFFAAACRAGAEGIVAKRADAEYRSGRTRTWLKIKCSRRQEFVIVGFTEPAGSRVGLGALLLAAHDARGTLRYSGKVGTGFDTTTLRQLHKRLAALERKTPPVADPPGGRQQHWVEPRLVAEISFSEWTRDGRVRHPVFMGLREDKPARQVRIETERRVKS